jgi:tripartite motif-containing protein 71
MSSEKTKDQILAFLEIIGGIVLFIVLICIVSSTIFQNDIKPEMPLPVANFSADQTIGKPPLNVSFTDVSKGSNITAWSWDFGDGSSEIIENPVHLYTKEGKYTVSLTVWNLKGQNSKTIYNYVRVGYPPIANFSASTTSGKPPLTVKFTDLSEGWPTSWKWTFGDSIISTVQNPEITFSEVGDYNVSLTVTNETGFDNISRPSYIHVTKSSF